MSLSIQTAPPSLIHHLPAELLDEIFLQGFHELASPSSYSQLVVYLNTLISVCSRWRQIALLNARLWSIICWAGWNLEEPPVRDVDATGTRLLTYLERSKSTQIHVQLEAGALGFRVSELPEIWELVIPHLERCQSLSIHAADYVRLEGFLPLPGTMKHLEKLEISGRAAFNMRIFTKDHHMVPPLRELYIGCGGSLNQFLTNIPVSHLAKLTLRIDEGQLQYAFEFIRTCQSLETLIFVSGSPSFAPLHGTPIPFELPRLTQLHIPDDSLLKFRRFLSTPRLEELTVNPLFHQWSGLHNYALGNTIISRSLTTLTLRWFEDAPPDELLLVLNNHPTITTLQILGWRVGNIVISWLAGRTTELDDRDIEPTPNSTVQDDQALGRLPYLKILYLERSMHSHFLAASPIHAELSLILEQRPHLEIALDEHCVADGEKARLLGRFSAQLRWASTDRTAW